MSEREIRRAGVLGRVKAGELRQKEAATILRLSYRQVKRLYRRYQAEGAPGLVHGNTGRRSNRAQTEAFRQKVLKIVRERYGGEPGARLGPTLAAEHLEEDHGLKVDAETLRRWMLEGGLWSRNGSGRRIGSGGRGGRTSGNWCKWTGVSKPGWKDERNGLA